ncbi:MAG: hypothetical protein D3916_07820 [Candidatus Electrothrix sp. MAN1_4]|nr:hypothetical protein [Candidatus Electrothrix sp. MAN1_4]
MPEHSRDTGGRVEIADARMKEMAEQVLNEVKLGVLKGVAHEINKDQYPLGERADSIESATIAYLNTRKQEKQIAVKKSVQEILEQSGTSRESLFGALAQVNLTSKKTVADQVKKFGLDKKVKIEPSYLSELEIRNGMLVQKPQRINEDAPTPMESTDPFGPITTKYIELGGTNSFLGEPVGEENVCPDGIGGYRHYKHGSIYWSPDTGACEIHGEIRKKWKSMGWEKSILGYPKTDVKHTSEKQKGQYTHFQKGAIYYSRGTGAHAVHDDIYERWEKMKWENS